VVITVTCVGMSVDIPPRVQVELERSEVVLRELIVDYLARRYDPEIAEILLDGEDLRREYAILVNGRNLAHVGGLDAILTDNSSVLITPIVVGG